MKDSDKTTFNVDYQIITNKETDKREYFFSIDSDYECITLIVPPKKMKKILRKMKKQIKNARED